MKEKKWIFFRVIVYLSLVIAVGIFALIGYSVFEEGIGSVRNEEVYAFCGIALLLTQIAFNILNIRLLRHYFFTMEIPDKKFNVWHTILLILNTILALLLLYVLFKSVNFYFRYADSPFVKKVSLQIGVLTVYAFVTITTIIGSIRLRNYIRRNVLFQENKWLNGLGT